MKPISLNSVLFFFALFFMAFVFLDHKNQPIPTDTSINHAFSNTLTNPANISSFQLTGLKFRSDQLTARDSLIDIMQ